jgi:lipopolysaccharide/colanic/teichoic acid biosynthesis glycosyltransferase
MSDREQRPSAPRAYKRTFDLVFGFIALVIALPVIAVLAIAVRIALGSPVLFRQTRPGLHGKPFTIFKFRTMRDTRDQTGRLVADSDRLTRFGRVLRSTSADELLELFNVLRGDMSLVGPRPLLMEYLERYTPEQMCRHDVKPGITGWAQINGRNAVSWDERFDLDVWYVDHHSVWLDMKVLALTVIKVLRRQNVNAEGHATMPKFEGPAVVEKEQGSASNS